MPTPHRLLVQPAQLKKREPFEIEVMLLNTSEDREQGFQNVSPFDAQMPLLFQWPNGGQRFIHNSNVQFQVKAMPIGHKNIVEQEIKLKDGDPSVSVTRPCRFMLEIPEPLFDTVKIEAGDTILLLPNAI